MTEPKIVFMDIEASDLKADWGSLLCVGFCYSWKSTVYCPSILEHPGKYPSHDQPLLQHVIPYLEEGEMIITWYGSGYDLKFIQTKCVEYRLPYPNWPPHLDLWVTPYKDWLLTSNRLKNVEEFLNLPECKTPLKKTMWRRARAGDPIGLKYVIQHCKQDVKVLRQAYIEMLPYIKNHPTMSFSGGLCPVCRIGRLIKKGVVIGKSGSYQRYKCKSCGHAARDTRRTKGVTIVPL